MTFLIGSTTVVGRFMSFGLNLKGTLDCGSHSAAAVGRKTAHITIVRPQALMISAEERPDQGVRGLKVCELLCPFRNSWATHKPVLAPIMLFQFLQSQLHRIMLY
jgi:hypothetical protein